MSGLNETYVAAGAVEGTRGRAVRLPFMLEGK